METEETPIEEERRLFASNPLIWYIVIAFWIWAGYLLIGYFNYSIWIGAGYLLLFIGWFANCYQVINEDERAKPIFLGQIEKVIGSGPTFILWPAEKLLRYPTGVQQISFATAGIMTARGASIGEHKEVLPSIVVTVDPVLNFNWPWKDDDLTKAIRNAPPPTEEGLQGLKNKIEGLFLDIVRTVGGKYTYEWIMQHRTEFAESIVLELKEDKVLGGMIRSFQLKNPTVSLKHIQLDKIVSDAMNKEASYYPEVRAKVLNEREIRIALNEVLLKYPNTGQLIETLITFREMAASGKTTYFMLPPELVGALSRGLGGSADKKIAGMSEDEFNQLIQLIKGFKK